MSVVDRVLISLSLIRDLFADGASLEGWPADESELCLVGIVMDSAQAAELGQLIGAAYEPYRFLARMR